MFPFLTPFGQPQCRFRLNSSTSQHIVEVTYLPSIPQRTHSESPRVASNDPNKLQSVSPRSSSKHLGSATTPVPAASPKRSPKSSPVPPPIPASAMQYNRLKNKGLQTSNALMELFGGGSSNTQQTDKSQRSAVQAAAQLDNSLPQASSSGLFNIVEDHDAAYERALQRSKNRGSHEPSPITYDYPMSSKPVAKPDEEIITDEEIGDELRKKLESEGVYWGNEDDDDAKAEDDDSCPAARLLAELGLSDDLYTQPISDLSPIEEVDTPASSSEWRGSRDDKLLSPDSAVGLPGPDLGGDDEVIEVDSEGRVIAASPRRRRSAAPHGTDAETARAEAEGADTQHDAQQQQPAAACTEEPHPQHQHDDDLSLSAAGDMALLIRDAQVVNDDTVFNADVLIENGRIVQVAPSLEAPAGATVIEAMGRLLLPAGIDVHTNFSAVDSADDFKIGGQAAVAGGTATIIELVTPRDNESLTSAVARVKKASESAVCNVGFSVRVRRWDESTKKEMETLAKSGVNSFALDFDGDEKLFQALDHCKTIGAHARVLPENHSVVAQLEQKMLALGITGPEGFVQSRPEELEKERVTTICLLSQLTNCPVSILSMHIAPLEKLLKHIQLTSAESAAALRDARDRGALAHPEVSALSICSDGSHYFNKCSRHAAAHLTESPLRTDPANQQKLLGTLTSSPLCLFASGHKAHSSSSRCSKDFTRMPKGVSGVSERLAVLWERAVRAGRLDPMRFVALSSTNAAKVFNLYPQKGRIAVGADADVVLWDPIVKKRLSTADSFSKADTSPFEGLTVHGGASVTIVGGRVAWKEGVAVDGAVGATLALPPHSPHLFAVVQMRDKNSAFEKVERSEITPAINGGAKREASPFGENQPPTARPRRAAHNESSISFGGGSSGDDRPIARTRNPPGGKTSGIW